MSSALVPPPPVEPPTVVAGHVACANCGATIAARFCAECGEERPEQGGLRLRHLVAEFAEHVADLDFRLVRTVGTLLRRPGQLTRDYVIGRRSRYVRPLALYLVVSSAFFLAIARLPVQGLNARQMIVRSEGKGTPVLFERIMRRTGETREQLATRVDASPLVRPRATAAFLVPVLALLLGILHARKRRLVAEHVLFAVHLQTFLLILVISVMGLIVAAGAAQALAVRWLGSSREAWTSGVIGLVIVGGFSWLLGYVYCALRRVYGHSRSSAAWRAALMTIGTPVALTLLQASLILLVAAAR